MKWFVRRKSAIVEAGIFKRQWPREIIRGPLDIRLEDGINQIVFQYPVQQWFKENGLTYGNDYRSQFRQLFNNETVVDIWFRDTKWAIMFKLVWGGK